MSTLMHYGIKGMKWGVRKKSSAPPASTLSTLELQSAVNRMQLERRYNELSGSGSPGQKAKNVVLDILKTEAKNQVRIQVGKAIGSAIEKAVKG